jgi:hypothetical protein
MHHIIIGRVYSREVWYIILDRLHLADVIIVQEEDVCGGCAAGSCFRNKCGRGLILYSFLLAGHFGKRGTPGLPTETPLHWAT